jgi:ABC-type nickel/cobalt efflux system permease component RcnA
MDAATAIALSAVVLVLIAALFVAKRVESRRRPGGRVDEPDASVYIDAGRPSHHHTHDHHTAAGIIEIAVF